MACIPSPPSPFDWPLYWFARLETAVKEGDHQAAAQAHRHLARLGVRVAYGRPAAPSRPDRREVRHG